jgi:uncharacterized protein YndB with AHSA1/START domain
MADIFHDLPIAAPAARVFAAVSTPEGLDSWWTKHSSGVAKNGEEYELGFGPGYDWRARVTRSVPSAEFELEITSGDSDWTGTRVGFHLSDDDGPTQVHFYHTGWPDNNEHYRTSCYCWAMYLRVLRRSVEFGEQVPYEKRLDA